MNGNWIVGGIVAAVCGIGGGLAGARLLAPEPASAASTAGVAPQADHGAAIAELTARTASVERALDEIRVGLADLAAAARRAPVAREESPESAPKRAVDGVATAASDGARSAFDRLLGDELSWDDAQAAWAEVEKAGRLDELVAAIEARAKARGNDPDAQTELGKAYLQKTFRAGAGPEAGLWATKADRAFDAALAIDDHHWESRFQKAVSLSFWPPMLGKQPDAVKQFETLVAQQEASGSTQPGYAETYLFLGNMHLQMGAKDKALAAWQKGANLFPSHAELAKKLADVQ